MRHKCWTYIIVSIELGLREWRHSVASRNVECWMPLRRGLYCQCTNCMSFIIRFRQLRYLTKASTPRTGIRESRLSNYFKCKIPFARFRHNSHIQNYISRVFPFYPSHHHPLNKVGSGWTVRPTSPEDSFLFTPHSARRMSWNCSHPTKLTHNIRCPGRKIPKSFLPTESPKGRMASRVTSSVEPEWLCPRQTQTCDYAPSTNMNRISSPTVTRENYLRPKKNAVYSYWC